MVLCSSLVAISLTINALFVTWMMVSAALRLLVRWRRSKLQIAKGQSQELENFVGAHRRHLAAIFVDSLLTIALFIGGLYLLTGGDVVAKPTQAQHPKEHHVNVALTLFCIAIGRSSVAIVMGIRRMRVIASASAASIVTMQCIDHLVSLVSLSFIVAHQEDLLIGSLLLIICIDCNVYSLNILLDKLDSENLTRLRRGLKICQCFLSIAFRFAVPVVCVVVSFVGHDRRLTQMHTQSLAIFISSSLFYLVYNIYIIVSAIIGLWRAYSTQHTQKKLLHGHVNDAFFLHNDTSPHKRNTSSAFVGTRAASMKKFKPLCSFTDLDSYLDQTVPPAYGNYRRLPTPSYFRPSLHVPVALAIPCHNVVNCKSSEIQTTCTNANCKRSTLNVDPRKIKRKAKVQTKKTEPFTADLPTINEEGSDTFSDISLEH